MRTAASAFCRYGKGICRRDSVYVAILALEAMGVFSNDSGLIDIDCRNQQPVRLLTAKEAKYGFGRPMVRDHTCL